MPAATPARHRPPFILSLPVKLAIVVIVGVAALAILEPGRGWAIEIVSWMLIAAGAVQLIAAIARPRS
jgi:hypothetical protein